MPDEIIEPAFRKSQATVESLLYCEDDARSPGSKFQETFSSLFDQITTTSITDHMDENQHMFKS
jgi:hypothetical protein